MAQESREEDAGADGSGGRNGLVQEVGGVLMDKKQLTVGPPTDASALLERLPCHIPLQPPGMCTQTAALGFPAASTGRFPSGRRVTRPQLLMVLLPLPRKAPDICIAW